MNFYIYYFAEIQAPTHIFHSFYDIMAPVERNLKYDNVRKMKISIAVIFLFLPLTAEDYFVI